MINSTGVVKWFSPPLASSKCRTCLAPQVSAVDGLPFNMQTSASTSSQGGVYQAHWPARSAKYLTRKAKLDGKNGRPALIGAQDLDRLSNIMTEVLVEHTE